MSRCRDYVCYIFNVFCFFEQKTAYEIRISDWSSDVCSSDLHGRPVAVLGGVRIPFCRQNTAYSDVGNLGMSVRTLGALVEKFGLHGQQLGEVAMGAVIKHPSDWNLGREATLSSGLSPLTPGITLQRACGTSLDALITI